MFCLFLPEHLITKKIIGYLAKCTLLEFDIGAPWETWFQQGSRESLWLRPLKGGSSSQWQGPVIMN